MTSNDARNRLKTKVLSDLAAICKLVAEDSEGPNLLRTDARELVEKFNSLLPFRGQGTPSERALGDRLVVEMAQFLPKTVEIEAWPAEPWERL